MAQEDINAQANGTHASAPSPAEGFEVLLITGMSGAGRSHAANSIEDMGWYVVDNMPPKLLVPLVDMMTTGANIHKLAAVEERDLLENLKERAAIVIDTSSLSIHQLSTKLYEAMLGSGPTTVSVHIFSFGFKYGIPIDADFVADVRFLPNPFWVPELRSLTGRDKAVSDYVLSSEGAADFLDAYEKAIAIAIEGYAQEDKHYVTIAIGCTGGQHRSVAMSEALAKRLRARGLSVSVSARELDKR